MAVNGRPNRVHDSGAAGGHGDRGASGRPGLATGDHGRICRDHRDSNIRGHPDRDHHSHTRGHRGHGLDADRGLALCIPNSPEEAAGPKRGRILLSLKPHRSEMLLTDSLVLHLPAGPPACAADPDARAASS